MDIPVEHGKLRSISTVDTTTFFQNVLMLKFAARLRLLDARNVA